MVNSNTVLHVKKKDRAIQFWKVFQIWPSLRQVMGSRRKITRPRGVTILNPDSPDTIKNLSNIKCEDNTTKRRIWVELTWLTLIPAQTPAEIPMTSSYIAHTQLSGSCVNNHNDCFCARFGPGRPILCKQTFLNNWCLTYFWVTNILNFYWF